MTLTTALARLTHPRLTRRPTTLPGPAYALRFATRQMVGNLAVSADGTVTAGYRIGDARWSFRSDDEKGSLLDANADVYAGLLGRTMQERITTLPHPVRTWARRLDNRTPEPLPDVHTCTGRWTPKQMRAGACGCVTWDALLTYQQRRVEQAAMDDKVVFRYFRVGTVPPGTDVRAEVLSGNPGPAVRDVITDERRVRDITAAYPWKARRMTEREQEWLRHRSVAIGHAAPALPHVAADGWTEPEMATFTHDVRWYETGDDRSVEVVAFRGGKRTVRHVTVLTLGRSEPLRYPENGLVPWQVLSEQAVDSTGAAFPVEWDLSGYLATGTDMEPVTRLDLAKTLNMRAAYRAHGEPVPPDVERIAVDAAAIHDSVTAGRDVDAGRFLGVVNAAVWGEDVTDADGKVIRPAAEVCADRAEALQRLYRGNALRMAFDVPVSQMAKVREFVPGEAWDRAGYAQQIDMHYLSAGMPNVSASVGDGHGPYMGYTRGAAMRPFKHDTTYATEGQGAVGRRENLWLYVGTLGSGKSVAIGKNAYLAARRNILTVAWDPSGPLGRLTDMPELAPFSYFLNMLDAEPGIVSPPPLVRDPVRDEYVEAGRDDDDVDRRWRRGLALAAAERRNLVRDVVRRSLEADLFAHPGTQPTLRKAAQMVTWETTSSLWDLADALHVLADGGDDHARTLWAALYEMSTSPRLSLMFPDRDTAGDHAGHTITGKRLIVISTPGLKEAPDGVPREDWTADQVAAVPLKHLGAVFAGAQLYGKPMGERALGAFDEADNFAATGAGRAFITRLGRDHSKWNMEINIASQDLGGAMAKGLRNFIAGAYAGRMANRQEAEAVLREVLDVQDRRYAGTLMRLSEQYPGEFIHLDLDRRIEPIRIDVDDIPGLRDHLLTTPAGVGASAWDHDEALA